MKQDTFNLDEGKIVLQWPMRLSEESLEEFEAWLDLILRRARRSVLPAVAEEGVTFRSWPIRNETAMDGVTEVDK